MRAYTFSIAFLLLSLQMMGQAPRILASKGKAIAYPSSNSSDVIALMAGKTIPMDYIIELETSSFAGIVFSNGKVKELNTPGKYPVKDLVASVTGSSNSTSERYANYVYKELTKSSTNEVNDNHRQYMSVTGSVERAMVNVNAIQPLCPSRTEARRSQPITLTWAPFDDQKNTYEVAVYNLFEEELYSATTEENYITVPVGSLKEESQFLWSVKIKDNSTSASNKVLVNILTEEKDKEFVAIYEDMSYDMESSIGQIANAAIYEQFHLYLDATDLYLKAMEQNPEVEDFKKLYQDYLTRIGVKSQDQSK